MNQSSLEEDVVTSAADVQIFDAPENHAFQMTPFGILPLNGPVPNTGDKMNVGGSAIDAARTASRAASIVQVRPAIASGPIPAQAAGRFVLSPGKPMTGRDLMQLAKARVQEIDRQLRSVPALQRERAQLQALVLAASTSGRKRRKAEGIQ